MSFNLRKRSHISYFEPKEPCFDEYIYCERCADFVYEHCALHGPLLVIPDNKIFDSNNKPLYVVDAVDSERSNWMRYVNCARHSKEQNLLAYQYRGQLYYRTIKIIPRFTELMVFYGSEFANALHINLKHYNSAKHYEEIIYKSIYEINQEENLDADQFYIIDADKDVKNSPKTKQNTNILSTNTSTNIDINKNRSEITSKNRTECEICHKTYANSRNLKVHALNHLDNWKYNCDHCPYRNNVRCRFEKHVGQHTNTYKFSCEVCPFKTNYEKTLKRHSLCHGNGEVMGQIPWKHCYFKTIPTEVLTTPMAKHKGKSTQSLRKNEYEGNQEECLDGNQFPVIETDLDFKNSTKTKQNSNILPTNTSTNIDINKNRSKITSKNRPKCEICHKTYANSRNLKFHALNHLDNWNYNCDHCPYRTNVRYRFEKHVGQHTNTYKFSCEVCPFKTNYGKSLKRHSLCHRNGEVMGQRL